MAIGWIEATETHRLFTMNAFEKSNNMENLWPFKIGFTENEVTGSLVHILYSYDTPLKRTKSASSKAVADQL